MFGEKIFKIVSDTFQYGGQLISLVPDFTKPVSTWKYLDTQFVVKMSL